MLSHQQTRHLDNSSFLNDHCVFNLEFPDEESFNSWMKIQNEIVEWNSGGLRKAPKSDQKLPEGNVGGIVKRGHPRKIEWTKNLTCSYGGKPRARSKESSSRTKSKPSRKVGCMARIKVQKLFVSDTIFVTIFNQHSGHRINALET